MSNTIIFLPPDFTPQPFNYFLSFDYIMTFIGKNKTNHYIMHVTSVNFVIENHKPSINQKLIRSIGARIGWALHC